MSIQVQGVVSTAKGEAVQLTTITVPDPGPGEALVRIQACGVCHTDLHYREGGISDHFPFLLGHEASGTVEAVGEGVTGVGPGDFVILNWRAVCGQCRACLRGEPWYCFDTHNAAAAMTLADGRKLSPALGIGAFAEQTLVHAGQCTKVDPAAEPAVAGLLGCGVMAGLGAALNTAPVRRGQSVAVIGCGGVGLAAINGAAIAGAGRIIAIDMNGTKLNLAKHFGATDVINARDGDPVAQVMELTKGGVHHSFEAIGLKQTAEQAFRMLNRGGTANIIGMIPLGTKIELDGFAFLGERRIQGSLMGSNRFPVDMPRLVDFYMSGKLKLDDMISRRIKLADINGAFEELKRGEIARSVIQFDA